MLVPRQLDLEIGQMTQGHTVTDDGVQLLYQVFGDGPAIVFANGIGVRYPGVVRQMVPLRQAGYRVVCWDYRGIGQSIMPDREHGDVSMARHARDALAILDHLKIDRAIFIGWSMGVQVSFEAIRLQPDRVTGLVALLGTYARPFQKAFPSPVARGIEGFFGFLNRNPKLAQGALNLAVAAPQLAFFVLSRALFVGADADTEVFAANVRSVAGVEKRLYTRTMLELSRHDASDILQRVACPALVIAGERDHLTPPAVAMHMARTMPQAAYREVKNGTHFAMIEQPQLINGWLLDFARQIYGERPD